MASIFEPLLSKETEIPPVSPDELFNKMKESVEKHGFEDNEPLQNLLRELSYEFEQLC